MSTGSSPRKLKLRHFSAIAVAAVVLVAIFTPFQHVDAFEITSDFPDTAVKSSTGSEFSVELEIQAGELISFQSITLINNEGEPDQKTCTFDENGDPIGACEFVIGSLEIEVTPEKEKTPGYAYGYGQVSNGPVGSGEPITYGHIGNNIYSYVYSYSTSYVNGYVGPVTITFSGLLNTGILPTGTNTFQISIDTGAAAVNNHLMSDEDTVFIAAPSGDVEILVRSITLTDDTITGMFVKVVEGNGISPIIDEGFTPVLFTEDDGLVPGETYTFYASDFGTNLFDHWENALGSTISSSKGVTIDADTGVELVAVYEIVAGTTAVVTIEAVDEEGDPIADVFNKINNASPPSDIVVHDKTDADGTNVYGLIEGNDYKVTIANKGGQVFEKWTTQAGSLLSTNRNYEFEATDGLVLRAVFIEAGDSSTVTGLADETGEDVETEIDLGDGKKIKIKFDDLNIGGEITVLNLATSDLIKLVGSSKAFISSGKLFLSVGGDDLEQVGSIIEIDLSGLDFTGSVTITLDYEGSNDNVFMLHFNEETDEWEVLDTSVDELLKKVTASSSSTSVFTVGAEAATSGGSGGGGGGGGGGSGGTVVITWPKAPTFPAEHFINFPLQKIAVANSAFINAAGISITSAQVNQQVSISGEFTNQQEISQNYAFIVQVTDENGYVTDISWQQGSLASGSTAKVSTLWTPTVGGDYKVQIFIWDGLNTIPLPLSEVTVKNIEVT